MAASNPRLSDLVQSLTFPTLPPPPTVVVPSTTTTTAASAPPPPCDPTPQPQLDEHSHPSLLAVKLLDCSSQSLRRAVGQNLRLILSNNSNNSNEPEPSHVIQLNPKEVTALVLLSQSTNQELSSFACDYIAAHLDSLPRGKLGTKDILQMSTWLLNQGMAADEHVNEPVLKFALAMGTAVAKEGETWANRLAITWAEPLQALLVDLDISYSVRCDVLRCSAAIGKLTLVQGCVKSMEMFPEDSVLVGLVCDCLMQAGPIEEEEVLRLVLNEAQLFLRQPSLTLSLSLLQVCYSKSLVQSELTVDLFEECDVMDTLNVLYRTHTLGPAGKLACATFLDALLQFPKLDAQRKDLLCQSGVIIRLVRLASFSAASDDDGDLAYLPAIRALHNLVREERIGARVMLAGGLAPLFAHANSNRNTRSEARAALKTMGVNSLGVVVQNWVRSLHEHDEVTPLENLVLARTGKRLLINAPPDNFFTVTVNNVEAILGKGAFSTVYKTEWNKQPVAVKRLSKPPLEDPTFAEEIRVLCKLNPHPNIVGLLGVYLTDKECLIVSELGGPTLCGAKLTWRERLRVLLGVAEGVRYLHGRDPSILHLDLKSSNILLVGEDKTPKLCDFGLAVELHKGFEFLLPGEHGTIQFMAPEVIKDTGVELGQGFDHGADVYSFSMVMWEVAHPGHIPWKLDTFPEINEELDIQGAIRQRVLAGIRPECQDVEKWPPGYAELMKLCWKQKSKERPRFVRNFMWDEEEVAKNTTIISVALRKMIWETTEHGQPVPMTNKGKITKWPSVRRIISSKLDAAEQEGE